MKEISQEELKEFMDRVNKFMDSFEKKESNSKVIGEIVREELVKAVKGAELAIHRPWKTPAYSCLGVLKLALQ